MKPLRIALAGNPNCGKTTLFNRLTGTNQYVGNWPGVTVEKKEGKLKWNEGVTFIDLPGIYSLSPYSLEERIARDFLFDERPDAIINIVDGSSLERSLYLTTQLAELEIPMILAVNMADILQKTGDVLDLASLSQAFCSKACLISALNGDGVIELANLAVDAASSQHTAVTFFGGEVEHAIAHIEDNIDRFTEHGRARWLAVRLFENDPYVRARFENQESLLSQIDEERKRVEERLDDDAEAIIANERYEYIAAKLPTIYKKRKARKLSTSDKIDRVLTHRVFALPIFALIMFLVYFLSVTTIGGFATDWVNDHLFGDGFHLSRGASARYTEAVDAHAYAGLVIESFEKTASDQAIDPQTATNLSATFELRDENGELEETVSASFVDYQAARQIEEPDPTTFGAYVPGIPVLLDTWLQSINTAPWLQDLLINGIVAGVGAVLGFVPQMLVLFLCLALLEACGYMARVAFIMDRIFRKFGLSGKSFIPMLIGTGCSVPAIMATRTIENQRDRRLTIITTPFMPCSAKLPIIAMITGALFGGAVWVAPSAYFLGIGAVIISGIILKKTRLFAGDPAPFVMELPAYRAPRPSDVLRSVWERGSSFIKKAGSVILLATILIWFLSSYGFANGRFQATEMPQSLLAAIGRGIAWIFAPLGFGNWQAAVASVTGLIAKENVVGTFGILYGGLDQVAESGWQIWDQVRQSFTPIAAYSFLAFNLLAAPCFAAIGAMKRELVSRRWTWFSVIYQTGFAYTIALIINQIGQWIIGEGDTLGIVVALILVGLIVFFLFKPTYEEKVKRDTLRQYP